MSPYGKCRGRANVSPAYRPANPCHSEDAPMLYEVRTYTLHPGTVAEFEERFAKRLPLREKHSKLWAFWHTEFGPLNQVIHVYPYEDLGQRTSVRAAMAQDTALAQLPGGGDLIAAMESEIMNPAPFMRLLDERARRAQQVRPHLGVQGSGRARPHPRGIP